MSSGETRPRRTHAQARAEMREGILRLGREQLAERGAAALSVREIARGLGVSSSAVYRHVRSRDELLTLLVVDAFTDLADRTSDVDRPELPSAVRLHDLAHEVFRWATENPARWALLYGSPVPGYAAAPEVTTVPGTRVMALFFRILADGSPLWTSPEPTAPLSEALTTGADEFGIRADPRLLADATGSWTAFIGAVSATVFGQLGPELTVFGEELLDRWVAGTAHRFSLSGLS